MHSTNTRTASMTPIELRHRMADLRMSKEAIAEMCGVDERTVRRWLGEGQKTAQPAPPYVRTVLDLYALGRQPPRAVRGIWDR